MRAALVLLFVMISRSALAGTCEDDSFASFVEWVAQRAAEAKPKPESIVGSGICLRDALPEVAKTKSKQPARLLASCAKILDKLPEDAICIEIAARLGKAEIGSHDIVATVAKQPNKLEDARPLELLGGTGAPRAAAIVIARWKELIPIAAGKEKNADAMNSWAAWRDTAAWALGATGDADAKAFLQEQAKVTTDRGVKRACADAIAAIDKRAAKK